AVQTTFLVNLVARECRLRQRREPGVCAADYLQRFPRHREQLEARLLLGERSPQSSRTPPVQPAALESILRRFETAWDHGLRPDLDDALAGLGGGDRTAVLAELIHAELEFRLKAGESARVEDYLRRYPELLGQTAAVVGLVFAEHRLRCRREPDLSFEEYLT